MLLDALHNRLILGGELASHTAIRIGAGRSTDPIGTDLPVVKDRQGHPYIPGSSLKGVLRAYTESVIRAVTSNKAIVCNPVSSSKDEWCVDSPNDMKDQAIYDKTCLVCRAFGSPWLASKIQVQDAGVTAAWFGQFQIRDGVAINRDTQTAENRRKYDFEVVPAHTRFTFSLVADNLTPDQIGMLCMGLRPFEQRELSIGGARSRGVGVVQLRLSEKKLFEVKGEVERLFGFMSGDDEVWETLTDESLRETYLPAFRDELQRRLQEGTSDAQTPA